MVKDDDDGDDVFGEVRALEDAAAVGAFEPLGGMAIGYCSGCKEVTGRMSVLGTADIQRRARKEEGSR